jgi:hypothetical protein
MNASDLFSMIDTNGDGTIDASELERYCALLRLPPSSVASLLSYFASASITRPAFQAALSRQLTPADLAPYLPAPTAASGGALPTAAAVTAAFAALDTRGAPPGCLHIDDLRVALRDALPALDKLKASGTRAPRPRATPAKGAGAAPTPAAPAPQLPLLERIDELVGTLTLTASGHVRYSELVTLLMK